VATASFISIENNDRSIDGIYCHYDGHPDSVGKILLKNYNTDSKIRELIDLGDISYLGPTVSEDATRSYFRWRNDPIEITRLRNKDLISKLNYPYSYLWRNRYWWFLDNKATKIQWLPLDQMVLENKTNVFYPSINEVYGSSSLFMAADDSVPAYLKREFRKIVKLIHVEMSEDGYTDMEVEDYLVNLMEKNI